MPATTRSQAEPGDRAQRARRRDLAKAAHQKKKKQQAPPAPARIVRHPKHAFEVRKTRGGANGKTVFLCSAAGCTREAHDPESRFATRDRDPGNKYGKVPRWCLHQSCVDAVCILSGQSYEGRRDTPNWTPERQYASADECEPNTEFADELRSRLESLGVERQKVQDFVSAHVEEGAGAYSEIETWGAADSGYGTPVLGAHMSPGYDPMSPSYTPGYDQMSPSYDPPSDSSKDL